MSAEEALLSAKISFKEHACGDEYKYKYTRFYSCGTSAVEGKLYSKRLYNKNSIFCIGLLLIDIEIISEFNSYILALR